MRTAKQIEGVPESYPAVTGVTGDDLAAAWQRVEHYISFRYAPREVVWYVESEGGEWQPPLAPVAELNVQTGDKAPYSPDAGPLGGWMLPCGAVKVTATVGASPAPVAVLVAVKRLAAYLATSDSLPAGVTRFSSGSFDVALRRDQVSPATAIITSGAADLLRPFRTASWAS